MCVCVCVCVFVDAFREKRFNPVGNTACVTNPDACQGWGRLLRDW